MNSQAKPRQDGTSRDRTGQDRTGQDRTGQDRTGGDEAKQDKTIRDETRQGTRQDKARQDKTRQQAQQAPGAADAQDRERTEHGGRHVQRGRPAQDLGQQAQQAGLPGAAPRHAQRHPRQHDHAGGLRGSQVAQQAQHAAQAGPGRRGQLMRPVSQRLRCTHAHRRTPVQPCSSESSPG